VTAHLPTLLADLDPHLRPGTYVFASVPPGHTLDVEPVASMAEDEGRTVVLPEADAQRLGLAAEFRCAWITLRVVSSLAAVGLLARVTSALAAHGISVNPVAGFHHDHLFVPHDRAADALAVLHALRPGSCAVRVGEFEIDDDPARVDRDVVWHYLSTQAYWGRSRSRADVETQLDRAWRVVGAYRGGELVGFARAVSDGVAFGYLADVFVLPSVQGAGVGKALVAAALKGSDRVRWTLFTRDAHTLYSRFGFTAVDGTGMVRPGGAG
jgi:GNAT superfamily N-acetyltransferase